MKNKETESEYVITKTEEEIILCNINDWDKGYRCNNLVGAHTLTYISAYTASRASGETTTVKICDDCYYALEEDDEGYLVDDVDDINGIRDIAIE